MSATLERGIQASLTRSALTEDGRFTSTERALDWLKTTAQRNPQRVTQIPFDELRLWSFEEGSGDLIHSSGKFFRVTGVHVRTDVGHMQDWEQPIIDQPEIGILGILAREIDGVLYLLMQAKMEPGNPLGVQLTPTVQATRSNYTQVHQGSRPKYLDHFIEPGRARVVVDQLQWEHGSVFLKKRNRNVVFVVDRDLPIEEGFEWLTLGQVKRLLAYPNLVSMDARTVIACLPLVNPHAPDLGSLHFDGGAFSASVLQSLASERSVSTDDEVQSWLTGLKSRHHLTVQPVGLAGVGGWAITDRVISEDRGRFFQIAAVDVESSSREVAHWTQPMIAPVERGLIGLLTTEIDGVLHALVKARVEPGCADLFLLGPTVQSALGFEAEGADGEHNVYFDLISRAAGDELRFGCVQSEEGGRFLGVQSEYRIVHVERGEDLPVPATYRWLTFRQIQEMLRYGLVSVEARSLLSCLAFT